MADRGRKARHCSGGTVRGQDHGEVRGEEPPAGEFTPFRCGMCPDSDALMGSVERAGDLARLARPQTQVWTQEDPPQRGLNED